MITVKKEKEIPVKKYRHPWIYQNSIQEIADSVAHGDIVAVTGQDGEILGYGFYSVNSKIACRMISFGSTQPEADWVENRLVAAKAFRETLSIGGDAFRLINAEGDFFPGLVIDVYNTVIVIRPLIFGTEKLLPDITAVLQSMYPEKHIFLKRDEKAARIENLQHKTGFLKGEADTIVTIHENEISYLVDILNGQKTGFYLDQRNNRLLFADYVAARNVCNMFSYSGGFSLSALKGGASFVTSVDASASALELGRQSLSLNHDLDHAKCEWIKSDAFQYLEHCGQFDVILLDPPPFARSKKDQANAIKGYRQLNLLALKKINPGGYLFTFSCSQAVTRDIFMEIMTDAGKASGRNIRICRELAAPEDHPFSPFHKEGEYLKGLVVYVE
ncbi:MAG: class I SAM-dependent rRNA methyltransferase [Spirochaetales bacterium]|nr:class I SAM-dependent rRNA methyltransferase [Spirochaetales bacterium]